MFDAPKPVPAEADAARNAHLGETILTLIQAFLKTGYYTPGHPETQRARAGLFDAVRADLEQHTEITFILVADGERREIFLGGVQSDPLPLSSLMLKSMGELFIPKFAEYFERKNLISFSLKSAITRREFEAFVDLMTEPPTAIDQPEAGRERMTAELVRLDIVMVSTVFNVDLVGAGRKLPWRVKNILSRLKRDLNLLPLYHDLNPTRLAELHRMVLGDIVRPLRNIQMLSELFLNLDLIGFDIAGIEADQLEGILIELVPTERQGLVAVELARSMSELQESFTQWQDVELLVRKEYLRRTLGRLGQALLAAGGADAGLFRQLVDDRVLRLEDLPEELLQRIAEGRLEDEFLGDPEAYLAALAGLPPKLAAQRFAAAQEQIPELIKEGKFDAVAAIFTTASRLGLATQPPIGSNLAERTLLAVNNRLAGKKEEQIALLDLLAGLGDFGVALLAEFLDSRNRFVRGGVLDRLPRLGPSVTPLILAILARRSGWYYLRNTLTVLSKVAYAEPEIGQLLRRSLRHHEPNVRKEAVIALAGLPVSEVELLLLPLLKDPHAEVRQRVIAVLGKQGCVHRDYLAVLHRITVTGAGGAPGLLEQTLKILAHLDLPKEMRPAFEQLLFGLLEERELFGLSQKPTALRPELKIAALAALGQIGSNKALPLLRRYSEDRLNPIAVAASEALRRLEGK